MDQISSHPTFNYAQIYQQNLARKAATPESQPSVKNVANEAPAEPQPRLANDFSSMFGDDELAKLQRNLESIAKLADDALRRFGV